jgi:heme A synthase
MIALPKKPEINYRTIKLLIGLIALTLPILTSLLAATQLKSISASYYEKGPAHVIFIGFLFAIAAFLAAYNGKERAEKILSRVASVGALVVASFPCCDGLEIIQHTHFTAAAIVFVILAWFCFIFYRRAKDRKQRAANRRAIVYVLSGIAIVLSIAVLGINFLLGGPISDRFPRLVFYGEWTGLLAFGISWLTASRILPLLSLEKERMDYRDGKED